LGRADEYAGDAAKFRYPVTDRDDGGYGVTAEISIAAYAVDIDD
jgi:hypothetical protein